MSTADVNALMNLDSGTDPQSLSESKNKQFPTRSQMQIRESNANKRTRSMRVRLAKIFEVKYSFVSRKELLMKYITRKVWIQPFKGMLQIESVF